MVGGGTVHWQGWLPRFTPEDFRLRTIAGDLPGTTLADWPISYDELEPYYAKVEWAFGVSGQAGANAYEGPRSEGYPCPPLPLSDTRRSSTRAAGTLGWNAFPTPQAALSRPHNGRPATVISAFAQQHGDPTGTRSSALNVFIPDALATGRYDLRPDSYVRELVVDGQGKVKAAVYQDEDGETFEQEADVFILACGAVETARLLLLSKSARFPNGSPTAATWSAATSPSTSTAPRSGCSTTRSTPGPAAATSAPARFEFYEHDDSTRLRQRRPHRLRRRRHPAADQLAPARSARPGVRRPRQIDRELLQPQHGGAMVVHDMPQHDNRVELDDKVTDAWGLPVARITLTTHENDLSNGQVPGRPRRRHPGGGRCHEDLPGLHRPGDRQLLAPARHHPDGQRPGTPRS